MKSTKFAVRKNQRNRGAVAMVVNRESDDCCQSVLQKDVSLTIREFLIDFTTFEAWMMFAKYDNNVAAYPHKSTDFHSIFVFNAFLCS